MRVSERERAREAKIDKALLRFQAVIQQDVVSVEFKAVLVINDDLLYTLQTADEDVVHLLEQGLHRLSSVLGSQEPAKLLHLPLTALTQPPQDDWTPQRSSSQNTPKSTCTHTFRFNRHALRSRVRFSPFQGRSQVLSFEWLRL